MSLTVSFIIMIIISLLTHKVFCFQYIFLMLSFRVNASFHFPFLEYCCCLLSFFHFLSPPLFFCFKSFIGIFVQKENKLIIFFPFLCQYNGSSHEYKNALQKLNLAFSVLFTIECVLKLMGFGIRVSQETQGLENYSLAFFFFFSNLQLLPLQGYQKTLFLQNSTPFSLSCPILMDKYKSANKHIFSLNYLIAGVFLFVLILNANELGRDS